MTSRGTVSPARRAATAAPQNRGALGLVRKLAPDARVKFADGEYEARLVLASIDGVTVASPATRRPAVASRCWRSL